MSSLFAPDPDLRRPWWMVSGHLETVSALSRANAPEFESQVTQTTDHDEVLMSWIRGKHGKPLLVLFHGLEGCAQSRAVASLARFFSNLGWTVAVPHFRSCGHMNTLPRAYHAADGEDPKWFLEYFHAGNNKRAPLFAAGISLGGNALIHCLAAGKHPPLIAAATISAPLNLPDAARNMSSGLTHLIYGRHFVRLLRDKVRHKTQRYPALATKAQLRKVRTIADFDKLYTAPVHGFKSAEHYWQTGSAETALQKIQTPLLCVNAQSDPLVPHNTLPNSASDKVKFCRPQHGGHGAFFGSPHDWLGNTLLNFFNQHMNPSS